MNIIHELAIHNKWSDNCVHPDQPLEAVSIPRHSVSVIQMLV